MLALLRFYDFDGAITLDGVDTKSELPWRARCAPLAGRLLRTAARATCSSFVIYSLHFDSSFSCPLVPSLSPLRLPLCSILALPLLRLRRLITLVPQTPGLFGNTVRDALAGPRDALATRQDEQGGRHFVWFARLMATVHMHW